MASDVFDPDVVSVLAYDPLRLCNVDDVLQNSVQLTSLLLGAENQLIDELIDEMILDGQLKSILYVDL